VFETDADPGPGEPFVIAASAIPTPREIPIPPGVGVRGKFTPRYLTSIFSVTRYAELVTAFREPLREELGEDPAAILTALVALSVAQLSSWQQRRDRMLQTMMRGYSVFPSIDSVAEWLEGTKDDAVGRLPFGDLPVEDFQRAIRSLVYGTVAPDEIDLWDRSGGRILIATSEGPVLMDHSAIWPFIDELFDRIRRIDGEPGSNRGFDFEEFCLATIQASSVAGTLVFRNEKLRRGRTDYGEIDIGWLSHGVLVLVECKGRGMHPDVDRGVAEALAIRTRDNEKSLDQIFKAATALLEQFKERLPKDAEMVVPLVVTPFPEYVPERSDRWLLTEALPRVMTVHELVEQLADPVRLAASDGLVIPLSHRAAQD
jgi:hypothetical protein